MTEEQAIAIWERSFACRIGTSDEAGWPYVVPNLFVYHAGKIYFHTAIVGHVRKNVESNGKVCIEVDEPGFVFPYGEEAPCETSVTYESAIAFGHCTIVNDDAAKIQFFERFMAKYADSSWERPNVWPLLKATTVFEVTVERMTAKFRPVNITERWKSQFDHLIPR